MSRPQRRGMTLMEALIFATIAVILIGSAWQILTKGARTGRTAVEGITLQQGLRNVVENMVRDVNGAHMILEPNGGLPVPYGRLVVYLHGNVDPGERAGLQPNAAQGTTYPFGATGATQFVLPVLQVAYINDTSQRTIAREVTPGLLVYDAPTGGKVQGYGFQPSEQPVSKVLAREVEIFELWPLALDFQASQGNGLPPVTLTTDLQGGGDFADRTYGVALRIKANFRPDDDTVKVAQDSSQEIVTRIMSYPRFYEYAYSPYFSSVDADLRY